MTYPMNVHPPQFYTLTIQHLTYDLTGFPRGLQEKADHYNLIMTIAGASERPDEVITPDYKYKYKQLPILESYEGTFPEEYWSHWDTNPYDPAVMSWVDPDKLLYEAQTSDYQDTNRLAKAVEMLRNGATLGTTGNSRLPSSVRNSRSVWEHGAGPKVADTLHDWVTKGIVF